MKQFICIIILATLIASCDDKNKMEGNYKIMENISVVSNKMGSDETVVLLKLCRQHSDKTAPCVHQNDVLKEINDSILCRPRKSF